MRNGQRLQTWNIYQSAWGHIDEKKRRDLLTQSVEDNIVYTDPTSQTRSLDELVVRIAQSQKQFPGAHFKNDSFLEHHDQALFHWTMYDGEGKVFVKGASFARFGNDGRLSQATGFFEAQPKKDMDH